MPPAIISPATIGTCPESKIKSPALTALANGCSVPFATRFADPNRSIFFLLKYSFIRLFYCFNTYYLIFLSQLRSSK